MLKSLTLKTFITSSGILLIGLVNSVILARWLGATGRGEVAAAMLWPSLLVYISSMGMITATIYFAALPETKTQNIFVNGVLAAIVQSIIFVPLGFVALPYLLAHQSSAVVWASRIYLLLVPISLIAQYGISVLQGRRQITAFNYIRLIVPVGYLLGTLIFWSLGKLTVLNLIWLQLSINFIGLVAAVGALLQAGVPLSLRGDIGLLRQMLKYGLKVQIGDISQVMNVRLDQAMMVGLLPPEQLGLYVVAVSTAGVASILANTVRVIAAPNIARQSSEAERASTLVAVFRKFWLVNILAVAASAVLLPFIIPLVFGVGFKDAVLPAEVLLGGTLCIGGKEVLIGGVQAMGSPWLGSRAELISMVVTVILLIILLPKLGIMGAAIATFVAYALQFGIIVYGLQHKHAIAPAMLFRIERNDFKVLAATLYRAAFA